MGMEPRPKKLLDQLRDVIRLKHYAYRTEETYVQWVKRYILFHEKRHPREMGRAEIEAFLTDLAVQQQSLLPPRIRLSTLFCFSTEKC
jgi:hypothetical protein